MKNATKEAADQAAVDLEEIVQYVPGVITDDTQLAKAIARMKDFIAAAKRKLPYQASVERDRERRRERDKQKAAVSKDEEEPE